MTACFGDPRLPARFWAKVRVDASGCWIWTASKSVGYGKVFWGGKPSWAHRVAYAELVGPIPTGLQLDHFVCATPACVFPDHLRAVTQRENVLRGTAPMATFARRSACSAGHEYTARNTYVNSAGHRCCRTCQRARAALREERGA